ncbi:TetR/AcrR family transcriptional regulator [Streptomyces sp. NPDC000345]|uniref:TetR/AcrR family transcriptional regulator n=1 Tax=Streptomyces sp. NPDC000345 TaxID=3364537 RepID=UPI0036CD4525
MAASDRRAELLEAAIRVMARDGVAKATTRAIVNEAGMTLGAFHYCFESRAHMLELVTATLTERYVADVRNLFAPQKNIRDSVLDSLHAFWKGFEANPGEHQISYELTQYALRNPGFENVAKRQYEIFLQAFGSLLDLAARNAGIAWTQPVPILARYVLSVIDGLNLVWLVDRNTDHSRAVLDMLAGHLLQHARPLEA